MPGLGTAPDKSGLKSPSGGAVPSPAIHRRVKDGARALTHALAQPVPVGLPHLGGLAVEGCQQLPLEFSLVREVEGGHGVSVLEASVGNRPGHVKGFTFLPEEVASVTMVASPVSEVSA